jgi:hypothetical protein
MKHWTDIDVDVDDRRWGGMKNIVEEEKDWRSRVGLGWVVGCEEEEKERQTQGRGGPDIPLWQVPDHG